MRTKQEIVENWLPRYTERKLEDFTKHILLTNFTKYVEIFADHFNVPILGLKSSMPNARQKGLPLSIWDGKCERCYNHGFIISSHAQSGAFPR